MGNCASSNFPAAPKSQTDNLLSSPAKVIHYSDGTLEEFRRRITAEEILRHHLGCYLCNSDAMHVNSVAPQLPEDYVLQSGQIYFLMPLSRLLSPLSLKDLCALAIKASQVINIGGSGYGSSFVDQSRRLKVLRGSSMRRDIITF